MSFLDLRVDHRRALAWFKTKTIEIPLLPSIGDLAALERFDLAANLEFPDLRLCGIAGNAVLADDEKSPAHSCGREIGHLALAELHCGDSNCVLVGEIALLQVAHREGDVRGDVAGREHGLDAIYQKALKDYFTAHKDELCETCTDRLERNPMRIIDCKEESDELKDNAPVVLDYLCEECKDHFEKVQKYLEAMNIDFSINPRIVRGLDYYTKTVFEFVSHDIGAQGTVCGGGRYDGLCEELGGKSIPALGFGMGIERLMLLLEAQGIELPKEEPMALYLATAGDAASFKAAQIIHDLRAEGVACAFDTVGRSIKAQMKYANKTGADFTAVIGDNELESGTVQLKYMETGETTEVKLDTFAEDFQQIAMNAAMSALQAELNTSEGDLANVDLSALLGGNTTWTE